MNNQSPLQWRYPVLLWLITVGLTPVLMVLLSLLSKTGNDDGSEVAVAQLFIFFGFFFSFPAFLFFLMVFHSFRHSLLPPWVLKLIFIVAAIAGMWVTLSLIGGSMIPELRWQYGSVILVVGLLLSVPPRCKNIHKKPNTSFPAATTMAALARMEAESPVKQDLGSF